LATGSKRQTCSARVVIVACAWIVTLVFETTAAAGDLREEIVALQTRFIADLNRQDFPKIAAAYHESYQGLITENGLMTLAMRKDMFRTAFASDDRAFVTVLSTDVRPLGDAYALLSSHIKVEYTKSPPKDFWYTAIYFYTADSWKIIHEH
jgi:ketosteroid isomerase-like protein